MGQTRISVGSYMVDQILKVEGMMGEVDQVGHMQTYLIPQRIL